MVRRRSTAGFRNGAAGGTLVDGVGTFGSVPNAGWRVRAVPPAAFIPSLVEPALLGRMHGAVRVSGRARSITFGARAGPAGLAGPKTWRPRAWLLARGWWSCRRGAACRGSAAGEISAGVAKIDGVSVGKK